MTLFQYFIRRLFFAIPKVLILTIIIFSVLRIAPGSPVSHLVPDTAPPEKIQEKREELGLDKPIYQQYFIWLKNVVTGNWGRSIISRRPVTDLVVDRALVTLAMTIPTAILVYLIAVPIGIISAIMRNTIFDHAGMFVVIFGASMPSFWIAFMLMYLFSIKLNLLPTSGAGGIKYLILPVASLTIVGMALTARITRSSMLEVIREDYIVSSITDGLPKPIIYYVHALKNALLPVITVLGLRIGWLIASGVLIEFVFARPGLGRALIEAIYSRDFPVVQIIMTLLVFFVIFGNLLADVLYGVVDPRIRY